MGEVKKRHRCNPTCGGLQRQRGLEGLVDTDRSQRPGQIDAAAPQFQEVLRVEQVDILGTDQHRRIDHER